MKNVLKTFSVALLLLIVTVSCNKDVNVTGVTLNKQSITLTVGEMETLTATVQPDNATNQAVSWTSSNTTVADVANNGVVTAKVAGTATITVTTEDGKYTATCTVTVNPVEQGVVINGIKWATRNVDKPGTFAAKPEDAGMFYQWNRKTGWSATDPMINSDGGTTWDETPADGDTLAKANDPCPTGWRVPTHEEQESLASANSEWTTQNGVNGRLFGNGENTLFLPAAGGRSNYSGGLANVGTGGYYWSSTPINTMGAYGMYFGSSNVSAGYGYRAYGISLRCVAEL